MIAADVVLHVRLDLNDLIKAPLVEDDAAYRTDDLLKFINAGLIEIYSRRPDLLITKDGACLAKAEQICRPNKQWTGSTAFSAGDRVQVSVENLPVFVRCVKSGLSGVNAPEWNAEENGYSTDGECSWKTEALQLPQQFLQVLKSYVLHRCYTKDDADDESAAKSAQALKDFNRGL